MADVFTTQSGIKQKAANKAIDYSTDNLFAGVWRLDQGNLDRFDPFITGYAFIMWTKLPAFFDNDIKSQFQSLTEKNFKAYSGLGDQTLNTEELTHGFAGMQLPVPTNLTIENTQFTIRHQELAGSPIRELYQYWITGIRDPKTGLATYHGKIADGTLEYSMKNHTAELLYVVTDPSGAVGGSNGIEFACYYTNVFPIRIPQDHLNYTAGDHGLVEIDMEFRGNFHQSREINELAVAAMEKYRILKSYGDFSVRGAQPLGNGFNE